MLLILVFYLHFIFYFIFMLTDIDFNANEDAALAVDDLVPDCKNISWRWAKEN